MEVKLFVHNELEGVEKAINEWLATHHVSIHHVTQSQSEKQGKFVFVVSVFYETSKMNSKTGQKEQKAMRS